MRKYFFALWLILSSISYSQQISAGFYGETFIYSQNFNNSLGINVYSQFRFGNLSAKLTYQYRLSEFSNELWLFPGDRESESVLLNFNYNNIIWNFEYYIGVGLGYYFMDFSRSGNTQFWKVINGKEYWLENIAFQDNWGYNVEAGIRLFPQSSINIVAGFAYEILNTDYSAELVHFGANEKDEISDNENISLNAFIFNLGLQVNF